MTTTDAASCLHDFSQGGVTPTTTVKVEEPPFARTVQARTGLSVRRFLRQIRPLRSATIEANRAIQTLPPAIGPDEQALLDDLKQTGTRH